jgi:hypothetical protein
LGHERVAETQIAAETAHPADDRFRVSERRAADACKGDVPLVLLCA